MASPGRRPVIRIPMPSDIREGYLRRLEESQQLSACGLTALFKLGLVPIHYKQQTTIC